MIKMILLIIGIVTLIYSTEVTFPLSFSEITLQKEGNHTLFQNIEEGGTPVGAPNLPTITKRYLLPEETDLKSFTLSLNNTIFEEIEGKHTIEPSAPLFSEDGREVYSNEENKRIIYSKNSFYPENGILTYSTGEMRGYKLLQITIAPYLYNPVSQKLKRIVSADIAVTSQSVKRPKNRKVAPALFLKQVKGIIDNSETVSKMRGEETIHYGILIPSQIKNQLQNLDAFIAAKEERGITVTTFTEDSWQGPAENGDVHQVRQWLKDTYESAGLTHILIIDHPVTGAIPMLQACPEFSGRYLPYIDMYYSDLTGEWDIDNDGKYGMYGFFNGKDMAPGGADQYPELFVGRIPFYGDIATTDKILKRITDYSQTQEEDGEWRKHLYLPLNNFDPGMDGANLGNAIEKAAITPSGWELTSLYGSECTMSKVTDLWNSADAGMVIWQAHGLPDYAENVMDNAHAAQLSDEYPSHVYQTSCHTGKPSDPNNLAFNILKNHAVSTIGNAVQCLYSASKSSYGEKGGARDYPYMHAQNMILNKSGAGESHGEARAFLAIKSSSDWLNCIEGNLYGCPEVGLYTFASETTPVSKVTVSTKLSSRVSTFEGSLQISLSQNHKGGTFSLYSFNGRKVLEQPIEATQRSLTISKEKLRRFGTGAYVGNITVTEVNGKESTFYHKISHL